MRSSKASKVVVAAFLWLAGCLIAFNALRYEAVAMQAPADIQEGEAVKLAVESLENSRGGDWRVVNAEEAEFSGAPPSRWVVLCARRDGVGPKTARVVEIDSRTGAVVVVRRPLPR